MMRKPNYNPWEGLGVDHDFYPAGDEPILKVLSSIDSGDLTSALNIANDVFANESDEEIIALTANALSEEIVSREKSEMSKPEPYSLTQYGHLLAGLLSRSFRSAPNNIQARFILAEFASEICALHSVALSVLEARPDELRLAGSRKGSYEYDRRIERARILIRMNQLEQAGSELDRFLKDETAFPFDSSPLAPILDMRRKGVVISKEAVESVRSRLDQLSANRDRSKGDESAMISWNREVLDEMP